MDWWFCDEWVYVGFVIIPFVWMGLFGKRYAFTGMILAITCWTTALSIIAIKNFAG